MKRLCREGFVGQFCRARVLWKSRAFGEALTPFFGGRGTIREQYRMGKFFRRIGALLRMRFRRQAVPVPVRVRCVPKHPSHKRWMGALLALWCGSMLGGSTAFGSSFVRFDFNLYQSSNRARNSVFIEVFDDRPLTRDNFLAYVNGGKYDGTLMHRLVKNFVLQGGGYQGEGVYVSAPAPLNSYIYPIGVDLDGNPNTPNPQVPNEFNNSPARSNTVGTLAMAKLPAEVPGGGPNSATSEFFFNLGNNSANLDSQNGGFTVFARVAGDGMNLIGTTANPTQGYNGGLFVQNLNPDTNGNGAHDPGDQGPFGEVPTTSSSSSSYSALVLTNADQVDYLGAGVTTTIPAGGLTFSTRDTFIDTGTLFSGSGELIVGANRTLGVREGTVLAGRSVRNLGRLEPGLQIGSVTVNSYRQDASGTLEIQINGTTVDTGYDRLAVTGAALLGGTLDVQRLLYNPQPGNTFTILTAGAIVGTFEEVNLPQLGLGLVWNYAQTNTAITLSVTAADVNRDGMVDAADYIIWRKNNGATGVLAYTQGDVNGDGIVNDADYLLIRGNFGNTRGGASGSGSGSVAVVPEPASVFLTMVGMTILACQRRNKRCQEPFVDR